jgi:hypothetical protein
MASGCSPARKRASDIAGHQTDRARDALTAADDRARHEAESRVSLDNMLFASTTGHAITEHERAGDGDFPVVRQGIAVPHQEVRLHDGAATRLDPHGPGGSSAPMLDQRALQAFADWGRRSAPHLHGNSI